MAKFGRLVARCVTDEICKLRGMLRKPYGSYMEAVRKLQWWRENSPSLPVWAKAARMAFGLSCTSAAAERVFSLVDGMIGAHQVTVLADQVQAGVMLRYNKGLDLELVSGSPNGL